MPNAITSASASTLAVPALRLLPPGAALTFRAWQKSGQRLGIGDAPALAGMATVRALMTCDQPELNPEFRQLFGQMANQIAPPAAVAHALGFAEGYLARARHDHHRATGASGATPMASKAVSTTETTPLRAAVDIAVTAFTEHDQRLAALKVSIDSACHRIIELQAERERAAAPLPVAATLEEHEAAAHAAADTLARFDVRVGYFRKLAAANAGDVVPAKHRVLQAELDLAQALRLFWADRQQAALADLRTAIQAPMQALVVAALRSSAEPGRFNYVDLEYVLQRTVPDLVKQVAEEVRANADTTADRILSTQPAMSDLITWEERHDAAKVGPTFGDPITPQRITAIETEIANRLRAVEMYTTEIAEKEAELTELKAQLKHAEEKGGPPKQGVTNPWRNEINILQHAIAPLEKSIAYRREHNEKAPAEIAKIRRELEEARTALELAQALAAD